MLRSTTEYLKMRDELDKVLVKAYKCFEQKLDEKNDLAAVQDDVKALAAIIDARASLTIAER